MSKLSIYNIWKLIIITTKQNFNGIEHFYLIIIKMCLVFAGNIILLLILPCRTNNG